MVKRGGRVHQNMAHRLAHVGDHALERRGRDSWPFTVVDLYETHALQILHRLADRRAPHSIALHQLTLGRERIAGPQVLRLNDRKQPVLDELCQLWPRHWIPLRWECALRLSSTVQHENLRHQSTGNSGIPRRPCLLRQQSMQKRPPPNRSLPTRQLVYYVHNKRLKQDGA